MQRPTGTVDNPLEYQHEEAAPPGVKSHTTPNDHVIDEATRPETPDPSIGPSQSASQVALHPVPRETVSRFFAPQPPQPSLLIPISPPPLSAPRTGIKDLRSKDDVNIICPVPPVSPPNFPPASITSELYDQLIKTVQRDIHEGDPVNKSMDGYPIPVMPQYGVPHDQDHILTRDAGAQDEQIMMYNGEYGLNLGTCQYETFHPARAHDENDYLEFMPGLQEHHDEPERYPLHSYPYAYDYETPANYEQVHGPETPQVDECYDDTMPYQEWLDECDVYDDFEDEYEGGYECEDYDPDRPEQETMLVQDGEFGYDVWSEEQFAEGEEEIALREPMYYEHEQDYGADLSEHREGGNMHYAGTPSVDDEHELASEECCADATEEMEQAHVHEEAFREGRALLLGLSSGLGKHRATLPEHNGREVGFVTDAELDVGKNMRDHWRPQRL
jgi:hypothetical protein